MLEVEIRSELLQYLSISNNLFKNSALPHYFHTY